MEPDSLTWVGPSCGAQGPCLFYRAVRVQRVGGGRRLSVGDVVPVRLGPGEPPGLAELQLLWEERPGGTRLSRSRLYFLPEDTPTGRTANHGQDEVVGVSERLIVGLEELVQWTMWDPKAWTGGLEEAQPRPTGGHLQGDGSPQRDPHQRDSRLSSGLEFRDILKEKAERGGACGRVLVRSYLQYCRYRAVLSRLRGGHASSLPQEQVLLALGGISSSSSSSSSEDSPRVLYCRETFRHPALRSDRRACRHLAPNLKGRPRKKKPLVCLRPDLQGQSQVKVDKGTASKPKCISGGHSNSSSHVISGGKRAMLSFSDERKERRGGGGGEGDGGGGTEEQAFLVSLYKYMKERKTPIQRIPYLGFKQINLWTMFQAAQKLGGYELITVRRQWKFVYDELGGNPGSTSAATCTRRHYERLILPYERFSNRDQDGPEDGPVPALKAKKREASHAAAEVSGRAPKVKLTNGVHPDKEEQVMAPKEQTSTADEGPSQKVLRLKLEPQILVTPSKPSPSSGQRNQDQEDEGSVREMQLTLNEETSGMVERNHRNRRSSCNLHGGDQSSLETDGKIENGVLLQSPTPKALGPCHVALDLWKAESLDQCHVRMVSPTLEHRESLESVPDPNSERADFPQKEDTFMGFTSLLYSPELNPGIMSPLAKKKLTSQVSRAELLNHKCFLSSFGAPSPLISSGLTNGVSVEAAGQPFRPSVIKHVHSFRTQEEGVEKMKDGVESRSTQELEDIGAPDVHQLTALSSHLSIPHVHPCTDSHQEDTVHQHFSPTSPIPRAPQMPRRAGPPPDHYFSSHIHNPYRRNKSRLGQAKEQGLRKGLPMGQVQGATETAALIQSETHSAESCFIFHRKSVKTESQASTLKQQLPWRDTSFTNEIKKRQWNQVSSLPKDAENSPHSPPVPCSCPDSSQISHMGMKDNMSADGDESRTTSAATDVAADQPTDLSLPKASSLKPFTQTSFLESLSCHSPRRDTAKLSDATSHSLSQNGHRIPGIKYHPRACSVSPVGVCNMNTHSPMNSSRQCMAGDSRSTAAETISNGHFDAGRRDSLEKGESGEAGEQYGRRNEAMDIYNKTEQTCTLRPILESPVMQQNVCTARPLKRPMERAEKSTSERKIRAVSPMHTTTLFASSTSAFSSLQSTAPSPKYAVASLCEQQKSQMFGEKCNGSTHAVAILKSQETSPQVPRDFLEGDTEEQCTGSPTASAPLPLVSTPPATPHVFPAALYRMAGGLSLTQLSDLAGCPSTTTHSLSHHTLEYLKNHSAAVLSPLVPSFAIHSFMMQRQLSAQAAASPVPITYRHPLAPASYRDLLHHRLFPVSSQPAYSPPQLNSVHPSTKLS